MKMSIVNKVRTYIDRYRVVSLCNLMTHFYYISKNNLISITRLLYKQKHIGYSVPEKKNPNSVLYFSKHFNPNYSTTIFDNDALAITKCITALDSFRNKFKEDYKIVYEELAFYPTVIKFGAEPRGGGDLRNIQLVYLPYSDESELAKYMGGLFDEKYEKKYNVIKYIVVESKGMLRGKFPQQISDYISNTKGFVICSHDNLSAEFYSPEELGVITTNE